MLPILLATVFSAGTAAPEVSRWEVHSEVALPRPLWLVRGLVQQPRATEVELDMALSCASEEAKSDEVHCLIEDAAVRAAAMPGDEGSLAVALSQADTRLTGAVIKLRLKNGRIRGLLLEISEPDGHRVRRVTRARDENLRLLVSRAISGFDIQEGELAVDHAWSQRSTWIAQLPAGRGTRAVSPMTHQVKADGEGFQLISGGDGSLAVEVIMADGTTASEDTFRSEIRADARFDAGGRLVSRRWGLVAEPTPSSGDGVHGLIGLPYLHTGSVSRLDDGATATIGASAVIEPKHAQPSALQSDRSLGIPPVGWRG